jgi:hypothetical protein
MWFRLALTTIAMGVAGCRNGSEMVLVVDTNLTSADIDDIVITVSGSQTQTIDVPSMDGGSQTFPLTLGLLPTDGAGQLTVLAVGKRQGATVVQQQADTSFADGGGKMLRLLLLDSCVGVSCTADSAAPQTCNAGSCTSAVVAASSLTSWNGTPPPRPAPAAVDPIQGRTIWSNGWHSCANEAGVLYCWGRNADGEIGDGALRNVSSRRAVLGISEPAAIGLGKFVTCVCDRSGKAWCWGSAWCRGKTVEGVLGAGKLSPAATAQTQVPASPTASTSPAAHDTSASFEAAVRSLPGGSNANGKVSQPTVSTTVALRRSTWRS